MSEESDFTQRFVATFPELQPLLDDHLADQEGELLPYLLMGDVADWLTARSTTEPDRVERILAWLDTAYAEGTFGTRNLIDVGIVEMLPAHPEGDAVLRRLGPELRSRAEVAGLLSPGTSH
jgi:hypothetical protein